MKNLNDILRKLNEMSCSINDLIENVKSLIEQPQTTSLTETIQIIEPTKVQSNFERLKKLLYSNKWPLAIEPELICDKNSEEEKDQRGISAIYLFHSEIQNKKFLDFGCGEGHVVKNSDASLKVGYDIVKSGQLFWEEQGDYLLTTDFNKIKSLQPFDVILLHDVIDHAENLNQLFNNAKSVAHKNTIFFVKCHPYCSRHGSHHYNALNKAFVHLIFDEKEMDSLEVEPSINTNVIINPLNFYRNLFAENSLEIVEENIDRDIVESFFMENPIIHNRIMSKWKRTPDQEFPKFQMEQSFVNYKLIQK